MPASVIVTITLDHLLANTCVAETADGTPLGADQLRRIADEADIWPELPHQRQRPTRMDPTPLDRR